MIVAARDIAVLALISDLVTAAKYLVEKALGPWFIYINEIQPPNRFRV